MGIAPDRMDLSIMIDTKLYAGNPKQF